MPTKSRLPRPDVRVISGLPQIDPIVLTARGEAFDDPAWVEKLALAGNMTAEEFRDRFGYLIGHVPARK